MRYNRLGFALCVFAATAFSGCKGNEEAKIHYKNKLFIESSGFLQEMRIAEDDTRMVYDMKLGLAQPESKDITATLAGAPELLEHFRLAYYEPDAELLPAQHYDLSNAGITIESGRIASDAKNLEFTLLDQLDKDKKYVLPVTIANANIDVLEGAKTLYFLFKEASLVNVVADILGRTATDSEDVFDNKLWPDPAGWDNWDMVKDMSEFTMEALVNIHAFRNGEIATVMGIEDRFLIRLGDAGLPKNQLQIALGRMVDNSVERGSFTNASLMLNAQRWYHIAVTFDNGEVSVYLDGQRKVTGTATVGASVPVTSVDFSTPHLEEETWGEPRCFWIGFSYADGRCLNGMISEVRIWNKALEAEVIKSGNHFYKVDPDSDGLIAYWKFDDGENAEVVGKGNLVKDHTVYGNHLHSASPMKWFPVALPEKNK